jgi:hypothetical protein
MEDRKKQVYFLHEKMEEGREGGREGAARRRR